MVKALADRRLDGALPCGTLGIGETVEVRTRMGALVARGEVYANTPFGVTLRENGTEHRFYADPLYLFMVEEPEVEEVAADLLTDGGGLLHPDARVEAKLRRFHEDGVGAVGGEGGNAAQPVTEPEGEEEPTPAEAAAPADDTTGIDPEALPDDIKQAVVTVTKMDGDQLNYVLAQVGQASMSALRRSGVTEAELHGIVQKIQNKTYTVLTGKSAREWKKDVKA